MSTTIKIRRKPAGDSTIPSLDDGELFFHRDSISLYVGDQGANRLLVGDGSNFTLSIVADVDGVHLDGDEDAPGANKVYGTNGSGVKGWQTGGSGTVTSVNITAPAAGITAAGGPITTSGSITLALANDLAALEGMAGTGLVARTAADTYAQRTLTGPAAGISVSNGDGVAGNPTLALANDLAALEALSGTSTIYYRSAADTWTAVSFAASVSFSGGSLAVADDGVTDAKLRNSGALSVIGRSANSTGDPADISASAASDAVLRESGSTVGWGTVATAGIANNAVTYAKIQDITATQRVVGRNTAGSGDAEEVTLTQLLDWISASVAQGDVLYRGAASWARLAAGTAYFKLITGGSGANPSWAGVQGCEVYHSVDQAIATGTLTAVAFDSERWDTNSFHDTSTNNSRITIPTGMGGIYLLGWGAQYQTSVAGSYRIFYMKKNGTTYLSEDNRYSVTGNVRGSGATIAELAAGDYVQLMTYQDIGANLTIYSDTTADTTNNYSPKFFAVFLGSKHA